GLRGTAPSRRPSLCDMGPSRRGSTSAPPAMVRRVPCPELKDEHITRVKVKAGVAKVSEKEKLAHTVSLRDWSVSRSLISEFISMTRRCLTTKPTELVRVHDGSVARSCFFAIASVPR
ncbi:hypothetical protein HAX54_011115, partial [Datura stramonium]|nr:hypothetical protein [Datura stramonium]